MKKILNIAILFIVFLSHGVAQVPDAFNYQAVVRNSAGDVIANKNMSFKISILKTSGTGQAIYVETHSATTNKFGLVNLEIGHGTVKSGVFNPGDWNADKHFIKVEFDPAGGNSFALLGTSQLLSVPYAFQAKTVENDKVNDADADATNEIQTLYLSGTQLSLSKGGGTVTLPSSGSGDNWGTQKVISDATLSGEGTTANPLSVANNSIKPIWGNIQDMPGGFADNNDDVEDGDSNPNNEIQTLSISGNDLSISDGNTVTLPAGNTSPWQPYGNNIFFNSGNVGIGSYGSENHALHVTTLLPTAIYGASEATSGSTNGGEFVTKSSSGIGVLGTAYATTGNTKGGAFYTSSAGGVGIFAFAQNENGGIGAQLSSAGTTGKGVMGVATATTGINYGGVFASKSTSGIGVFGEAEATSGINYGGKFKTRSATGYSGYFEGGKFYVDGDVGIGTDNPWFKLHVNGGGLFMEESGGLFIRPDVNKVNVGFHSPSGYSTNAVFSWDKTQFSGKFIMLNGNVGIGTEEPQRLLHLAGTNPRILIEATSSSPEINFKNTGDLPTSIWSIYKNGTTGDMHFYQNGNKLTIQKNTGNVGIGTTSPQGKLDVNGTIYQRGGILHADYVFEDDYQLESIEEHAEFMWKNKHLPAIPKVTTDENGFEIVEVGSHRKGIVEELEKAHIYISQLEKKLQQQNTIIKDLKLKAENKELTKRIENLEKRIDEITKKLTAVH